MTRRDFLRMLGTGTLGAIIGFIMHGCGTKPEEPTIQNPEEPGMSEEQKKEYVFSNCVCGKCPSWVECGEKGGFCLVGKSKCIKEKKGCICPDCPVTKKMGLKWGYYCIEGDANSIKAAEMKGS